MKTYVILGRKWLDEKCIPLLQVDGSEYKAVEEAHMVYGNEGLNRVVVVDTEFSIVFKMDRRCKCTNCQYEIDGKLRCMECRRDIRLEYANKSNPQELQGV